MKKVGGIRRRGCNRERRRKEEREGQKKREEKGEEDGRWKRRGREEEDVERTTKVSDLPLRRRLATRHVILAGRWSLGGWSLLIRRGERRWAAVLLQVS